MENKKTGERKGQALVELAVFSAIFLLVLTAIVSYGLRFSYNQRAQMLAFRRALKIASDTNYGSGSYTVIQERHIPDLSDPFGIGSTMPFVASASVTRNNMLDAQPDDASSLPATVFDIETVSENGAMQPSVGMVLRNAAFRNETVDTETFGFGGTRINGDLLKKYRLIYSTVQETDGAAGQIKIVDQCAGEMMSYDACYEQALKIVNVNACMRYCHISLTEDGDNNCSVICSQAMNSPNQNSNAYDDSRGGAWYAANYRVENGIYVFPVLDEIFNRIGVEGAKTMGLQQNRIVTEFNRQDSFRKIESTGQIVTNEQADWSSSNTRKMAIVNNMDSSGYSINHDNPMDFADQVEVSDIESRASGRVRQTMTTPK